ncbi:STAS/SEC14 domain-containing protein [Thermodesulfobacteriota bacterium]
MRLKYVKVTGNILSIQINSEVSKDKFNAICNEIEKAAAALGKIRLVLVIKHYPSFNSAEDLFEDLGFVKLYSNCIDKVAVVCDITWKQTWLGLFSLFSGVKMEFFDISEINETSNWIQTD